jgi:hypothetical protein
MSRFSQAKAKRKGRRQGTCEKREESGAKCGRCQASWVHEGVEAVQVGRTGGLPVMGPDSPAI